MRAARRGIRLLARRHGQRRWTPQGNGRRRTGRTVQRRLEVAVPPELRPELDAMVRFLLSESPSRFCN